MSVDQTMISDEDKAKYGVGIEFGIDMVKRLPNDGDRVALEAHITGVLIVFWGALWGTFGTEYAQSFIEAQLKSMEPGTPRDRFTPPEVH